MKKRWWWMIFILLIIIVSLSFYFDRIIEQFLSLIRNSFLNQIFFVVKFLDMDLIVVGILTLVLLFKKQKRWWVLPIWLTMGITAIVSVILKVLIHRARPFVSGVVSLLPGIAAEAKYLTWDFSFPSFDTALIFCTIPIISKLYPKWRYPLIVFAILVGLSRIYFGLHYLSDVICGALIGFLIGILIVYLENKYRFFRKMYKKIFRKK